MTEWGLWIAAASLVVALGVLLDQYHIRHSVKSRARDVLTAAFVWLDELHGPDLPILQLRVLSWPTRGRRPVVRLVVVAFSYAVLEQLLLGGGFGSTRFLSLTFNTLVATVLLLGISQMAARALRSTQTASPVKAFAWVLLSALLIPALAVAAVGALLHWVTREEEGCGALLATFAVMLWVLPIVPLLAFALLPVPLLVAKLTATGTRLLLFHILDVASDPRHSPFAYASAVGGVGVLFLKLLHELLAR